MSEHRGASTLADVAELAGVSRQTVSNAINNPTLLRHDTLDRVRHAIDALGYSPNRAARNLRKGASHLIGLRFTPAQEGTANATIDRFVHKLVESSAEAGYHILLFPGDGTDSTVGYEELVRAAAVDAFIATDTFLGNPQAAWLHERGVPFVAFGRPWHGGTEHTWVDVDGAAGTALATRHLRERGHHTIGFIGWPEGMPIGEDRLQGWLRETPGPRLTARVDDTVAAGRDAALVLMDDGATAIVCASDTLALGVFHALARRGLRPGDDVAVVGFDDSQVAQVVPPGLTSVRQPLEDVAIEIIGALTGLLEGDEHCADGVLLEPTLEIRGSSGPQRQ